MSPIEWDFSRSVSGNWIFLRNSFSSSLVAWGPFETVSSLFSELWSLWQYMCHASERERKERRGERKQQWSYCPKPLWLSLLSCGKWASGTAKFPVFFFSFCLILFCLLVCVGLWQKKAGRQIQSSGTVRSDVRHFSESKSGEVHRQFSAQSCVECQFNSGIRAKDKDVNTMERWCVLDLCRK